MRRLFDIFKAAEPKMVVVMAVGGQDPGAMPKRGAPAAPVGMGADLVPDKPAALHFGDTQTAAATAGHLIGRQGKVHMLGRVAI